MTRLACQPFATLADVLDAPCACDMNETDDGDLIEEMIDEASDFLFVLSGGRFTGVCQQTVWPIADRCNTYYTGIIGSYSGGERFASDSIVLHGPNTEVVQVTIDGAAIDPIEYLLIDGNMLVRRSGRWPVNNDITRLATDPGTFTVTYRFGTEPTAVVRRACVELVCSMIKSDSENMSRLRGVVSATVQGVNLSLDQTDDVAALGLPEVTRFLDLYSPRGLGALGVYSPELNHGWRLVTVQ